jgi:hypothetical protein
MDALRRVALSTVIVCCLIGSAILDGQTVERDGRNDFDFEIGEWSTHVKRLQRPLSGSTTWVEYAGTTSVRGVLGTRANLAELVIEGPSGKIEGAALRLYHPATRQWSIHYVSVGDGSLTAPLFGEFRDGRGVFSGEDTYGGRTVLVRFLIIKEAADRYRFEQSFSDDGGEHWELNWVATDTRRKTAVVIGGKDPGTGVVTGP